MKQLNVTQHTSQLTGFVIVMLVAVAGYITIQLSHASTPVVSVHAANGTVTAPATKILDSSAAGGSSVVFGKAAITPPSTCVVANVCNYSLKWADEFNGNTVNPNAWNVQNNSNYGVANKEDECYLSANTNEVGGALKLEAKKQTVSCGGTNPDTGNSNYYVTSGFVTTQAKGGTEKYAFTKGYIEASIKLPKGSPYWGAFWLVGGNGAPSWPQYGEFDIMEQAGAYPDAAMQTLHYGCATGHCQTSSSNIYNLATNVSGYAKGTKLTAANFNTYDGLTTSQFVRYGFLWENNKITWYINGRPTRSFDGTNLTVYSTNPSGDILSSSVAKSVGNGLSAVTPSFATMLSYPHAIHLNLAYGGSVPVYDGYTGGETSTGYNNGNGVSVNPGSMEVDYVRVYQQN